MNLIIIRGMPGSGKSSMARQLLGGMPPGAVWVEADHYFEEEDGSYNFDRLKLREAHAWCKDQVSLGLEHGCNVIVSNTFTTKVEMKPYFDIAHRHGIIPTLYLCQNDWGSVHNVPQETLDAMRKRFEFDISSLFWK